MTFTPPDVHHINTYRPGGVHVELGFVDTAGVYHFPNGAQILANGRYILPDGTLAGTSAIVASNGAIRVGGIPRDAQDPESNEANTKHAVDSRYQAAYNTAPESFTNPAAVFASVGGDE